MRYRGPLYRALNPLYAADPLSGEGARRFGGRFNAKGVTVLYTSLSPHTALRESNQVGTLQPTVLVGYDADIAPLFDATDPAALLARGMTIDALGTTTWRDAMDRGRIAPTQAFVQTLIEDGFAAVKVPSFARGAGPIDTNVVLFRWGDELPARLRVVDDERRLPSEP